MSGKFAPIGQIMPSTRTASTHIPHYSAPNTSDLSFQEVLSRYQATSAQTQAQAPQFSQTLQSRPVLGAGSIAGTAPSQTQAIPTESLELMQKMPAQIPEGGAFQDTVMKNMQDYWAMKAETKNKPQSAEPMLPTAAQLSASKKSQATGADTIFGTAFSSQPYSGMEPVKPPVTDADYQPVVYPVSNPHQVAETSPLFQTEYQPAYGQPQSERGSMQPSAEQPKKRGLFGAITSFFKNVFSGLTLGFYRPNGEAAPTGLDRAVYPIKKLVYDAPIKDIAVGVPVGIYNDVGSVLHKPKRGQAELPPFRTAMTQSADTHLNRPRWTEMESGTSGKARKTA